MRKHLLFLFFLTLTFSLSWAQKQISVSGVVLSTDDKEPVIAATVVSVEYPGHGSLTDAQGKFTLKLPANAKSIKVSSIGYVTQTVAITGKPLTIYLKSEDKQLDKVVVVAYGTQTKNSFTGSAARVSMDDLKKKSVANITNALEGASPGVQVFTTSGQPGADATIQIRGIGSVNSSTAPLYIVDGIPYGSSLSGINFSDIESLNILKDASATALYGARAANGVVLITTRQGKRGSLSIEADYKIGINKRIIPLYDVIESPEEYVEVGYQGLNNLWSWYKRNMFVNYDTGEKDSEGNAVIGRKEVKYNLKERLGYYYSDLGGAKFKEGTSAADVTGPGDLLFFDGILDGGNDNFNSIGTGYNIWKAKSRELIDPTTGKFRSGIARLYTPDSWRDNLFRTGSFQEGNVRVSGGSDKINFSSSLGYQKNLGYYVESDFKRLTLRNNVTANINKHLKFALGLSYANTERNSPGQSSNASNGFQYIQGSPALYGAFYHNPTTGELVPDPKRQGQPHYDFGQHGSYTRKYNPGINPLGSVFLDKNQSKIHLFTVNLNGEYRFLNDFKLAVNYGTQIQAQRTGQLQNPYYGDSENVGRIYNTWFIDRDQTFNQILSWGKAFGEHHVDAFVAHESTEGFTEYIEGNRSQLVLANSLDLNDAAVLGNLGGYSFGYAMESYFGQVRYDWQNKYFVSASLRRDGTSRFAPDKRWGTFGSVGAAWIISREKFFQPLSKIFDNLKLKASYGVLGNQMVSIGYSDAGDLRPFLDFYSVNNINGKPGFRLSSKGNPDLTWENTKTFNTGFEAKLFNRLEVNLDFFIKDVDNMLFSKEVAPSLGYSRFPENDGQLRTSGLEFEINYDAIRTKDIDFSVRFNGGFYRSKMITMPIDNGTGQPKPYESNGLFRYTKGRSIYDYYIRQWMGVDQSNGRPIFKAYTYKTQEADPEKPGTTKEVTHFVTDYEQYIAQGGDPAALTTTTTDDADNAVREFINKTAIPDLTGGLGLNFRFKNLHLSANFSYGLGGWGYDYTYAEYMNSGNPFGKTNFHKDFHKAWTPTNTNTDIPAYLPDDDIQGRAVSPSTRFLTSRSYLNLTNARIAYDLPSRWLKSLGLGSASVYVSGDNLFLISARKGFAPMSSSTGSSNTMRYLPVSTFVAGVNVRF